MPRRIMAASHGRHVFAARRLVNRRCGTYGRPAREYRGRAAAGAAAVSTAPVESVCPSCQLAAGVKKRIMNDNIALVKIDKIIEHEMYARNRNPAINSNDLVYRDLATYMRNAVTQGVLRPRRAFASFSAVS